MRFALTCSQHSSTLGGWRYATRRSIRTQVRVVAWFFVAVGVIPSSYGQSPLYTEGPGANPPFDEIRDSISNGYAGTLIDVNNELVEGGLYGNLGTQPNLKIHTLASSVVSENSFGNWTRWYQTDGATQIFRLFPGEENVRNSRPLAARIEAFDANTGWNVNDGEWHDWVARYTIVKPINAAIFQAKDQDDEAWSVHLGMDQDGSVFVQHRRPLPGQPSRETLIENAIGQPFDVRVRDNGLHYEVYLGDQAQPFTTGQFVRNADPGDNSDTRFRWGIYVGAKEVESEAMIFVSHATVDPTMVVPEPADALFSVASDGALRFRKGTGVVDGSGLGFVINSEELPIGQSGAGADPYDRAAVMVFQLPDLGSIDAPFQTASFQGHLTQTVTSGGIGGDLYGIARRDSPEILDSDYYGRSDVVDSNAVLLQDDYLVEDMAVNASVRTSAAGSGNLLDFLNEQYAGGDGIGDYVFLRLNVDTDTSQRWSVTSGNASDNALKPQLLYRALPGVFLDGDYNRDGSVNMADYTVWRDNLGDAAGALPNDPHSSPIGQQQYATWRANFGETLSSTGAVLSAAVPEPSSLALLVLVACGSLASRPRA